MQAARSVVRAATPTGQVQGQESEAGDLKARLEKKYGDVRANPLARPTLARPYPTSNIYGFRID